MQRSAWLRTQYIKLEVGHADVTAVGTQGHHAPLLVNGARGGHTHLRNRRGSSLRAKQHAGATATNARSSKHHDRAQASI
jgi:hypothetical protein